MEADEKVVEFLLEQDKDLIHCRNGSGMTPLHTAATTGALAVMKLLISRGSTRQRSDLIDRIRLVI
jgi:ankyrin repeat protein